jgi:hypothetical protein
MIETKTTPTLIAPCGINCRLCHAYVRKKKPCPGCQTDGPSKSTYCLTCKIKTCEKRVKGDIQNCFACDTFPCARLKQLDKRYRTKYGTSPIENLVSIQKIGVAGFVKKQNKEWMCPQCGAILCMHSPQCLTCGYPWPHQQW